ncbi:hypothetical protein DPEC_G00305870 [Dallia pectoralis]|uniref:Uncharacterized protein n=1 Tax=Dallia pectoralis TaxID=75939 RepID=A0ACC2FE00_DALPE|nr:hypothetical protein DPEC_G00305870 [Dallia pectoralis]
MWSDRRTARNLFGLRGSGPFTTCVWVNERLLSASLSVMHCHSRPGAALIKMPPVLRPGRSGPETGPADQGRTGVLLPQWHGKWAESSRLSDPRAMPYLSRARGERGREESEDKGRWGRRRA